MSSPLSRSELRKRAAVIRKLLDSIEAGEMTASVVTIRRLEGAWLVLESLARGGTLDLGDLIGDGSVDQA